MPNEQANRNDAKEKGRKRTREGGSQTDEEDATGIGTNRQPCGQCSVATNSRLSSIEEKLNLLLTVLPELESYKSRINQLEEENKSLQRSLQYAHAEIEDLKAKADVTESQQQKISDNQGRINSDLKELQRRHIKLECHSRRGNLKFFRVKEGEHESNSDTETILRDFMRTKLKIPSEDLKEIYFDRVHRISTHTRDGRNSRPRPIIVKLSAYQDKNFIKSFIKNIPKGTNIGISDDFPKEVDEMRKKLYPVLKTAKREKKEAYFKVEKLLINGSLYRGPETAPFPLYGCLMNS